MPGPLSFLDDFSRVQITDWLRHALTGKTPVPLETPDESVRSAILAAEPLLTSQARRDLAHAVITLTAELKNGPRRTPAYVDDLMGMVVGLELSNALPTLLALTGSFLRDDTKLSHAGRTAVAFAIVDLRVPQSATFWLKLWEAHPRDFSSPAFSALLDLDPCHALGFLPELGNDQNLADAVALHLDYHADQMPAAKRDEFRSQAAAIAANCKSRIREGIREWLQESGPPSPAVGVCPVPNSPLALALGVGKPATARLCAAA
ncbi:MAG: hypothetical protein K9N23_02545 [Akkermansiaceae bacterium]|nr:hypothetical protein [Akkermansiaceae bacterium]